MYPWSYQIHCDRWRGHERGCQAAMLVSLMIPDDMRYPTMDEGVARLALFVRTSDWTLRRVWREIPTPIPQKRFVQIVLCPEHANS